MGLDASEIEGIAKGIYGEAREDVDDPPGTVALARRILGDDAVRPAFIDNMVGDAMLVREWDRWIIVVRRRLTFERQGEAWVAVEAEYVPLLVTLSRPGAPARVLDVKVTAVLASEGDEEQGRAPAGGGK